MITRSASIKFGSYSLVLMSLLSSCREDSSYPSSIHNYVGEYEFMVIEKSWTDGGGSNDSSWIDTFYVGGTVMPYDTNAAKIDYYTSPNDLKENVGSKVTISLVSPNILVNSVVNKSGQLIKKVAPYNSSSHKYYHEGYFINTDSLFLLFGYGGTGGESDFEVRGKKTP